MSSIFDLVKVFVKITHELARRHNLGLYRAWHRSARLEKALGVSEAVSIRLVPMQCLGILGVA
jgi:hypothetical protein